jgi:hypothetical protein
MKIIITESHFKNTIFKFFDKFGGEIDTLFIDNFRVDRNDPIVNYETAYKYLIEWRGEKESKELAKTLLLQNRHHIDDYGGYDFFFEVVGISNWYLDSSEPNVVVKVKVDDLAGTVDINGGNNSLEDALDNDEYGWEIDDEVNWGIDEYFKKNITSKTGIKIIFDRPKYASRIFNFN